MYSSFLEPSFILQKRVLRAMTYTHYRTSSRPLFENLHIVNIFQINDQQPDELVYRHQNNSLPEIFEDYFRPISSIHYYNTRLYLPKCRLNYGKFSVRFSAGKAWNSTPLEIKESPSLSVFRRRQKKFSSPDKVFI